MLRESMLKLMEELKEKFTGKTFTELGYDRQADIDHTQHYYSFEMIYPDGKEMHFILACVYIPYNEMMYDLTVRQVLANGKSQKKRVKLTRWDIEEGLLEQLKKHFNMK